jgi:hypothetical protein
VRARITLKVAQRSIRTIVCAGQVRLPSASSTIKYAIRLGLPPIVSELPPAALLLRVPGDCPQSRDIG